MDEILKNWNEVRKMSSMKKHNSALLFPEVLRRRALVHQKWRAGRWHGGREGQTVQQYSSCLQAAHTAGKKSKSQTQRPVTHDVGMGQNHNTSAVNSFYLISLFQERSRTASVCPSAVELCNNGLIIFFCTKVPWPRIKVMVIWLFRS